MSVGTDTALGLTESRSVVGIGVKVLLYAVVVTLFAGPLIALLSGAFSEVNDPTELSVIPNRPTLDNFAVAFDFGVLGYLANSFFVVGFGLLLQVIVSVLAGYALARKRFRFSALRL